MGFREGKGRALEKGMWVARDLLLRFITLRESYPSNSTRPRTASRAIRVHRARVRNAARGRYRHIVSNLLISQFRGALMFY